MFYTTLTLLFQVDIRNADPRLVIPNRRTRFTEDACVDARDDGQTPVGD